MRLRVPFLLILILLAPRLVVAQNALDEVDALLGQGRIFQARELLQGWWEGEGTTANRMDRQRSIWLRGRLTVDPSMAELDFRRLVLEFPGGPFSDDALLRLAQAAEFRGELRRAHSHYASLEREYPSSPLRGRAQRWLRVNGSAVETLDPEPSPGTEAAPGPILNQEAGSVPDESHGAISVQVGAFRNLAGARSLASDLRASGYQPRLVRVPGNNLIRVRLGRFSEREEASGLQRRLAEAGLESTIVSDARSEEEIG